MRFEFVGIDFVVLRMTIINTFVVIFTCMPACLLAPSYLAFLAVFSHGKYNCLHANEQLFELMRGLDKDCDSTIDIQEFASRFEPVFTRLNLKQDVSDNNSLDRVCGWPNVQPLPSLDRFCGRRFALHENDGSKTNF